MILTPELICELPVFAASGLVINSGIFFIVSDDEVSLLYGSPGKKFHSLKLWDHTLPEDLKERKKVKPDLESLYLSGEKLFLLPSFSKKNRDHGAVVDIGPQGEILSHQTLNLSSLRKKLDKEIPDLNIEGGVMLSNRLHLFQRGNGKDGSNAIIICKDLLSDEFEIRPLKLPDHQGVPVTVTDAALKGSTIFFTAVAEDSDSTYLDGEVMGSYLGTLDDQLMLSSLRELNFSGKPEGLSFDETGDLYFVTDDDSRDKPSRLFVIRDY